MRTCYTGQVCLDHLGQTVTLFGWVQRRRDHGGIIFIDLRDREGLAQVVCDPDESGSFAVAESLRNEYCVRITGIVRARPEGTVNADLKSGEIEVLAKEIEVLNASVTPPFQLDDDNLSETTRLTSTAFRSSSARCIAWRAETCAISCASTAASSEESFATASRPRVT